jgi:hypothetical protein
MIYTMYSSKLAYALIVIVLVSLVILIAYNRDDGWYQTGSVGGEGGQNFEYKCPDGEYVQRLYMDTGDGVTRVGASCSGASDYEITSPMFGINKGNPVYYTTDKGIESYKVTGHQYVGNVTPGYEPEILDKGGLVGGVFKNENNKTELLQCPDGTKVSGLYGKSGAWINKLGFWCN